MKYPIIDSVSYSTIFEVLKNTSNRNNISLRDLVRVIFLINASIVNEFLFLQKRKTYKCNHRSYKYLLNVATLMH